MLSGNIIDSYPDNKKNLMVTWISTEHKPIKITEPYKPSFYVYTNREDLITLATILRDHQQVEKLNFPSEKIILGKEKKKLVLEITPKKLKHFRKLAETVDSWGGYHKYQLYNVDLRLSTRYLQDKKVFFNAHVKYDGKKIILDDEQWAIDYKKPEYSFTTIDIKQKTKSKIHSFETPIKSIKIGDTLISERSEIDTILLAVKQIKKLDPDILFVKKGDSILFPYLLYRAKTNNIQNSLILGRDKKPVHPNKQAKSYFSYGHILYRPAFYTLKGRAHLATHNSFMYGESGIHGLIDMSRCSNIPLQILSRVGPGTAISQMQVNKAREKKYLIPYKKNTPENWKTAMQLLVSDRGGLILDPVVGLHEDIIELDFASLYPNVMLRFNISPETMLCDCCKFYPEIIVPQLGYHICSKKTGLIPEVLKPVLYRRFCYKARSKNKKYDTELYKEMQKAWKWVLLVCFGYTGYRNARYGRIECYESITAFARDILLSAIETVEQAGYGVLHGIIDSLWVKPKPGCVKPAHLSRMISNNTGVRMDIEGHYKWIVFLPSKNADVGALNRYYGMFDDGEIKARGVEIRQKNSPVFLKNMQKEMLNVFSKADTKKEFKTLIPEAIEVIKEYGKKIIDHEYNQEDLVIKTCVSKDLSEYKVNTLAKSAMLQMRKIGIEPEPGQSIYYVVRDEKTCNPFKRVCILENLEDNGRIDTDFYLRQIAQYGESILIPFGFTLEKFYDMLQKIKYRERYHVSILQGIRTHQTSI